MNIETGLLLLLVGFLAGSMLFFAVVVAPIVFSALPPEHAGSFLRAFFPYYYLWGILISLILAGIAMSTKPVVSIACFLLALLFIFSRQHLMPRINHARDIELQGTTGASRRFKRLHLLSVSINGFQILALFVIAGQLL